MNATAAVIDTNVRVLVWHGNIELQNTEIKKNDIVLQLKREINLNVSFFLPPRYRQQNISFHFFPTGQQFYAPAFVSHKIALECSIARKSYTFGENCLDFWLIFITIWMKIYRVFFINICILYWVRLQN